MAYDPAKSEQTKEEMKQKVIELAKNFKDNPQNMIEYLQFSTRFYNYSSRNTLACKYLRAGKDILPINTKQCVQTKISLRLTLQNHLITLTEHINQLRIISTIV